MCRQETVEAIRTRQSGGKGGNCSGHHILARAGSGSGRGGGVGRGREHIAARPWRYGYFYYSGLPFSGGGTFADKFSPAALDLVDARGRVWRTGKYPPCIPARDQSSLPIFQLWRRHADCEGIIVSPSLDSTHDSEPMIVWCVAWCKSDGSTNKDRIDAVGHV